MKRRYELVVIFFIAMAILLNLGSNKITISEEIDSTLPAGEMWRQVETAFKDSGKSNIWPHELEKIKSNGLGLSEPIDITYFVFGKEIKYPYKVTHYERNIKFRYEPVGDHPFRGSGRIMVVSKRSGGSVLKFDGEYRYEGISLAALYFKLHFKHQFFKTLKAKLKPEERFYAAKFK